jgi:hypothetical protein
MFFQFLKEQISFPPTLSVIYKGSESAGREATHPSLSCQPIDAKLSYSRQRQHPAENAALSFLHLRSDAA